MSYNRITAITPITITREGKKNRNKSRLSTGTIKNARNIPSFRLQNYNKEICIQEEGTCYIW